MATIILKNKFTGQTIALDLSQEIIKEIDQRLSSFQELHNTSNEDWFSELCFCILTANSQAKKAIEIQKELGAQGFLTKSQENLAKIIRAHSHRFHNTKAKYIVGAKAFANIRDILIDKNSFEAREFIVKNIKGLGYKEASHFLRNVGYHDVAIIDRHILKFLAKYGLIKEIPPVITKKTYLKAENLLKEFNMPLDKLDLILWYHMTGFVLK